MHTDDITFKVTGRDAEKLNEFQKLHDGCLEGMAGGRFSYSFSPTSLGMAITVSCSCGQKLFLGNFMNYIARKPLPTMSVGDESPAFSVLL